MSPENQAPSGLDNERTSDPLGTPPADEFTSGPSWLQLALVAVLVCALTIGPITLLNQLDPAGPWTLMPIYALIVATESVITGRWLVWPERKRQRTTYSLAELVVLLTLAPLFLWLSAGQIPVPNSLLELLENPFVLFSVPLSLYVLLAVMVWALAHKWSALFIHLAITHDEIRYYRRAPSQRSDDPTAAVPIRHRDLVLKQFVREWITGGVVLIIVAALVSFDLQSIAESAIDAQRLRTVTRLGLPQGLLLALFAYFLVGLWLIGQGRSVVLEAKWLADGSQGDVDIVDKWRRWTLILIVALALVALLLPIGTSYPLLRIFLQLVQFLTTVVGTIIALIFMVIFLLLPNTEAPYELPMNVGETWAMTAESTSEIPAILVGSFFWMSIIAVVIVSILFFMRSRGFRVSLAQMAALLRRFYKWLLALGHGTIAKASILVQPNWLRIRRPALPQVGRSPFDFLRVGSLPPREQVRFLYLSLVRFAAKQELPRPPAMTPIEFGEDLKLSWPDADDDLERLTDAFLAARYSTAEIDEQWLSSAKEAWLNIRRRKNRPRQP